MIKITPQAAEQIRAQASRQPDGADVFLRIAATLDGDGVIQYGMGWDQDGGKDIKFASEGVNVVVAPACEALLIGATLDYVEINPGEFQFIFVNPNDKQHRPAGSGGA
ncbi:MAG TPA: iron-sulfur cluster biosynthesis family protein [Acidiferrobacterales bacterium]|jgi:iron-sulfur cluster assembly protein